MNTHMPTVWSEGPRLLLTRPLLQYMHPGLSGAFKGPSKSVILAPEHSVTLLHTHTHTHTHTLRALQLEGIRLSLPLSLSLHQG